MFDVKLSKYSFKFVYILMFFSFDDFFLPNIEKIEISLIWRFLKIVVFTLWHELDTLSMV